MLKNAVRGKPLPANPSGLSTEYTAFSSIRMWLATPSPSAPPLDPSPVTMANTGTVRPLITFIDTPGAYPGKDAEERGQGEAIARKSLGAEH